MKDFLRYPPLLRYAFAVGIAWLAAGYLDPSQEWRAWVGSILAAYGTYGWRDA